MKTWQACLVAVLAVSCARPRATWPPDSDATEITVSVQNDLTSRSDVIVRMLSSGGSTLLGGVSPGERERFGYSPRFLAGSHALTASTGDGRTIRSRSFRLFPGAVVTWRLRVNDLQVTGRSASGGPGPTYEGGSAPPSLPLRGGLWHFSGALSTLADESSMPRARRRARRKK